MARRDTFSGTALSRRARAPGSPTTTEVAISMAVEVVMAASMAVTVAEILGTSQVKDRMDIGSEGITVLRNAKG